MSAPEQRRRTSQSVHALSEGALTCLLPRVGSLGACAARRLVMGRCAAAFLTMARTRGVAMPLGSWSSSHQPEVAARRSGCIRAPRYFSPHTTYPVAVKYGENVYE